MTVVVMFPYKTTEHLRNIHIAPYPHLIILVPTTQQLKHTKRVVLFASVRRYIVFPPHAWPDMCCQESYTLHVVESDDTLMK